MADKPDMKSQPAPGLGHRLLTALGVVLCVILTPMLVINCVLLVKGFSGSGKVPSFASYMPFIILTDSMYPEFSSGDLILCRTLEPGEVRVGDVISFFDPDGNGTSVVSHRVLEISSGGGELSFRTKGDANNAEDPSLVPAGKLVGRYTGIRIAGAGNVAMFMQTTPGLLVCVVLPLALLVGWDMARRSRYEKRRQGDKEELLAELEQLRRMKAELDAGDKPRTPQA